MSPPLAQQAVPPPAAADDPGRFSDPHARGTAAIAGILAQRPYAIGTREHVRFVKGLVDASLQAMNACKAPRGGR